MRAWKFWESIATKARVEEVGAIVKVAISLWKREEIELSNNTPYSYHQAGQNPLLGPTVCCSRQTQSSWWLSSTSTRVWRTSKSTLSSAMDNYPRAEGMHGTHCFRAKPARTGISRDMILPYRVKIRQSGYLLDEKSDQLMRLKQGEKCEEVLLVVQS